MVTVRDAWCSCPLLLGSQHSHLQMEGGDPGPLGGPWLLPAHPLTASPMQSCINSHPLLRLHAQFFWKNTWASSAMFMPMRAIFPPLPSLQPWPDLCVCVNWLSSQIPQKEMQIQAPQCNLALAASQAGCQMDLQVHLL